MEQEFSFTIKRGTSRSYIQQANDYHMSLASWSLRALAALFFRLLSMHYIYMLAMIILLASVPSAAASRDSSYALMILINAVLDLVQKSAATPKRAGHAGA